jgi:hypothetical protein
MATLVTALMAATAGQAAVTITSDVIDTPGLSGFKTYTFTALSDGAPIQGFDFVGDPTAPVDPLTSRGIFGSFNQITAPVSTIWTDNDALLSILVPGSNAQQDTNFLFNSSSLLIIPGSARETATSLQAAFSTSSDFGQSVKFAELVVPVGSGLVSLRGVVGTRDGMEFPVSLGGTLPLPPLVVDTNLGDQTQGNLINHPFTTSAGALPITWDNLLVSGAGTPAIAPTLNSSGMFSWNSAGSPLGLYNFDVTATNAGGSDVGRLSLNLVAPPPLAPVVVDHQFSGIPGDLFMHTFQTVAGDPPITWSNLTSVGSGTPAIAPQLSSDGQFTWDSTGSEREFFHFRVTATNSVGSDNGDLIVDLREAVDVPEPSTMTPLAIAFWALFAAVSKPPARAPR